MKFAFAFFALVASLHAANTAPKNVLFFLVDDLGITDLACYGSDFHESPHLDRFARTATRYTNAYAASPVCSPTRAAILTGRYPSRVNITDWIPGSSRQNPLLATPEDRDNLAHSEITLAEHLQTKGYQTYYAGKWHLGDEGHFPEDQGFEINKGGNHKGSPNGGYYAPFKNPRLVDKPDDHHLTKRLADESIHFLNTRDNSRPFLLYHAFYTVHTPTQGDDQFDAHFTEKAKSIKNPDAFRKEHDGETRLTQSNPKYASMVKSMDQAVGRILDELDRLNLADDTLVIFTSDNGGLSTKPKPATTSNEPFRAGKGWCYEGGIRVPLIIRAPGKTDTAASTDTPAISMDFFPTILDYLGLPLQPKLHNDGVSLFSRAAEKRDTLYWHYPHYHGSAWEPGAALRQGDWKIIEFYETSEIELYDLANDPSETRNLAKTHPEKVKRLLKDLRSLQKKSLAILPSPNLNYKR